MNIIIDTHIFLWAVSAPHKISKSKRGIIETLSNTIYVSSITITELMIKSFIGKLDINFNPIEISLDSGFELLDFSAEDALVLKNMPFHHKDPFDMMLISQSINRKFKIMSDDSKFRAYGCELI